MGVPHAALQGTGTTAQLPAQFPEPLPRGVHAPVHLPARPDVSRAAGPARPRDRRADAAHEHAARPADHRRVSHDRAHQSAGTAAGSAGARRCGRAAGKARAGRRREDRPRHGARHARPDPAGARRRHPHRDRSRDAARLRPSRDGDHPRRRLHDRGDGCRRAAARRAPGGARQHRVRAILHVDMDAFYASVEALDNPELRGKPLIVGGLGGRGVVAAASYEVRKYGVQSAMPMREALRRCPHAICVPPRFSRYQAISRLVFGVFHEFTPLVQGLSLDEAFLDVTHSQAALGSGESIAIAIKQRILARTGLTASVGVAPNKLVAKIASDLRKPDGLVVVSEADVTSLLDPLPVRRLFGIGNKTTPHLERIGIMTLRDLRLSPDAALRPIFGRYVAQTKARAAGIDDRPVIADWDEKRISAEETFDVDLREDAQMHAHLAQLTDRMAARLRSQGWLAETVV